MALTKAGFIPIPPGEQLGFEDADVYRRETPAAARLYVAHTGPDRIDAIDCPSNSYLRSLLEVSSGGAGVLVEQ